MTDRHAFKQLIAHIEQELHAQTRLKTLLTDARVTLAGDRPSLRTVETRIKLTRRDRRKPAPR
jgi:hypothetical protein